MLFRSRGQLSPHIQGWFSEEFGLRIPNTVLSFERAGALPFVFGYVFTLDETLEIRQASAGPNEPEIQLGNRNRRFLLRITSNDIEYQR